MEKDTNFAWDTRTNKVYEFRRLQKYVLLKDSFGVFLKIPVKEFDANFEGTPPPLPQHKMLTIL
jgi:hypothetical protein